MGNCTAPGLQENILTVDDIAALWIQAGGDPNRVVVMTAIALCESCNGDASALSPQDARGLWQILGSHAHQYGYQPDDLYNPRVNADLAVKLSYNGAQLAAWDTAYANLANAAQRYPITEPEPGSCASNSLQPVALVLGVTGTTGPPQARPGQGYGIVGTPPAAGQPTSTVTPPPGLVIPGTPAGIPRGQWQMPQLVVPPAYGSGWDNLIQLWGNDGAELYSGLRSQLYQLQTEFGGSG